MSIIQCTSFYFILPTCLKMALFDFSKESYLQQYCLLYVLWTIKLNIWVLNVEQTRYSKMPSFRDLSVLDRMNVSQGSYYSTFVWRFTNPLENPSFKEFAMEPFDAGYMISCVIFVILGSCGIFLNGRAFYYFFRPKTVSFRLLHTYGNNFKFILQIRVI